MAGEKCEEAGINIFPEFPASEILYDENERVIGVRTGDKGIDKEGNRKGILKPALIFWQKLRFWAKVHAVRWRNN